MDSTCLHLYLTPIPVHFGMSFVIHLVNILSIKNNAKSPHNCKLNPETQFIYYSHHYCRMQGSLIFLLDRDLNLLILCYLFFQDRQKLGFLSASHVHKTEKLQVIMRQRTWNGASMAGEED